MQLIQLMNDRTPAMDSSWTVGRKEPVLALHEGLWQRGLAIKKKGQDFDVFLVDAGQTVTISQVNMRSLPQELRKVPPFLYQVGRVLYVKLSSVTVNSAQSYNPLPY